MSIARGTAHIASVEDGKDAVWYEIMPDTYAVSLDADGNWTGVNTAVVNGVECAAIRCSFVEHTGSREKAPDFYCSLVYGDNRFYIDNYSGVVYIKPTDTSVDLTLYKLNENNPPLYTGNRLAKCTIMVNRAGANGTSVKVQFSVDGSGIWHDAYQAGDKYIRIWNGSVWSAAIKFVGDNGNSFNTKGAVAGHYEATSAIPSPVLADKYIVDRHDTGSRIDRPCFVEYIQGADSSVVADAEAASMGDAYVVQEDNTLWVANETEWINLGQIQGPKGDSITIISHSVKYATSASATTPPPSSSNDWRGNVQNITSAKPYLWTWTRVVYSNGDATDSYSVTTRGNRGAVFRQHDGLVKGDYSYQSGSGTEEFIDAVRVGKVWYRCIQSYSSKDVPAANDVANTKYWSTSGMTNMDFIATQLLLAEDATINMLGTNEINLYDGDSMFGSFRVPHNAAGVSGGVDGNKYALWLGNEMADVAPFSVTKYGAVHATSGSIGSFDIVTNKDDNGFVFYSLHAHSDGSAATAPNSVDLYYNGIEVRTMARSDLGGIVQVGGSNSTIGGEYAWNAGLVNVIGYFSGSAHGMEQVAYGANMNGNNKNTVTCYKANAQNGAHNYALHAVNGDVVAENGSLRGAGFCGGVGLSLLSLSSGKRYYNNSELDIRKNSTWLVTASADNANVLALPKLGVARELACNASAFCMRLTIIAKAGSAQFYLAGRNASDANLSSNEYPVFLHNDGGDGCGINMASGDVLELALVYDGSSYCSYLLGNRN